MRLVSLPADALAALRALTPTLVTVRDVWWVPCHHVAWFPGGKGRFCLVVGIEPVRGASPPLVHLVAGSTRRMGGATALRVPAGLADLAEDTNFVFRFSGSLPATVLAVDGKPKGRLPEEWEARIAAAVMASRLAAVKRLWT
jgi:hypothetical protein